MSTTDGERMCRELLASFGVTNITRSGDELVHSCPLPFGLHKHGDANPSANLNFKKMVFHCHGCGQGGSLTWFVAVCRDVTGEEARRWLRTDRRFDVTSLQLEAAKQKVAPPPIMPYMSTEVLNPWLLIHPYLTEIRGIPEDTLIHFRVGWDQKANRIVIPHFWKGKLVGWQTRRLVQDGTPKYKSSADFPKDRTLYNHDPKKPVVVVESPMSVLAKHHTGVHLEATFGASVTDRQSSLIADHPEVILFFDPDQAGWTATQKVGEAVSKYVRKLKVVNNPWAADAADLTDEVFLDLVENAVPFPSWRVPTELSVWPGNVEQGTRVPCEQEKEEAMGIVKHGHGEVLPEPDDEAKAQKEADIAATSDWSAEDKQELADELDEPGKVDGA